MDLRSMRAVLPFMGMVIVILVQVGNMFVIKKAISIGINKYVIVVYTDLICSLIFLLFILITHRSVYLYLPARQCALGIRRLYVDVLS